MTPSKALVLSLSLLCATTTAVLLFLFLLLNALAVAAVVALYTLLPALSLYYYFIHTQTSGCNRNAPRGGVSRDGESRMFERLVTQVIHGYLGRYFHKQQLKITIWNEEVFLENVEPSLEAFEYLQLPFALKQGWIGKISIKIPWKKLGWDPFVISLENVYLCASQRDDEEWSLDEVEKREFAGKKAKLAAAELAKLSKRKIRPGFYR